MKAFILKKLAGKKKQSQLDFQRELAMLLIAGYNGYKCPTALSVVTSQLLQLCEVSLQSLKSGVIL